MTIIRSMAALLIWVIDFALKMLIGFVVAYIVWYIAMRPFGFAFGTAWSIGSALLGLALVGFFDGDDLLLNGFGKRIIEANGKRTNNPMDRSGGSAAS
jgi:uncharacterized membrane protein required for colicin V production